jgi:hypothetical protein
MSAPPLWTTLLSPPVSHDSYAAKPKPKPKPKNPQDYFGDRGQHWPQPPDLLPPRLPPRRRKPPPEFTTKQMNVDTAHEEETIGDERAKTQPEMWHLQQRPRGSHQRPFNYISYGQTLSASVPEQVAAAAGGGAGGYLTSAAPASGATSFV